MFEEDNDETEMLQDVLLIEEPEQIAEADVAPLTLPLGESLRQSFVFTDEQTEDVIPLKSTSTSLMSRPDTTKTMSTPLLGDRLRQSFIRDTDDTSVPPDAPVLDTEIQQDVEDSRQKELSLDEQLLRGLDSTDPINPFYVRPEVMRVMEVDEQQQLSDPYAGLVQRDPRPEGDAASDIKYTPRDLLERDDLFQKIEAYMVDRRGVHIRNQSREETVSMFMADRRKFDAMQGWVTVTDALWTRNQVQNERWDVLERAKEAQSVWNNMAGFFTGEYTGEEQQEAFLTYLRSIIIDPTNILSLAGGHLLTRTFGARTSKAVTAASTRAAERAQAAAAVKGASPVAQTQVYREAEQRARQRFIRGAGVGQSAVQRQSAIASGTTLDTVGYWMATGVTDASLNFSLDSLYQLGMINIDMQDEFSGAQAGIAALIGLTLPAGGLAYQGVKGFTTPISDSFGIAQPGTVAKAYTGISTSTPELTALRITSEEVQPVAEDIVSTLTRGLRDILDDVPVGNWKLSVAKGEALKEGMTSRAESNFWKAFLLSDNGLAVALAHAGFGAGGNRTPLGKRFEGDNLTNNVADILRSLPEGQKIALQREFQEVGGAAFPRYKDMTMDDFANVLSFSLNKSASEMATMSGFRRKLDTYAEYIDDMARGFSATRPLPEKEASPLTKYIKNPLQYIQDFVIRAIVTHPATTARNVTGWGAYESVYAPLRDAVKVALYGGAAVLDSIHIGADPMTNLRIAKAHLQNQMTRLQYAIDPMSSIELTREYAVFEPEVGRMLGESFFGGVGRRTSGEEAIKKWDFDPMENPITRPLEETLRFFQSVYGTVTQDMFTKSISFNTNMDRLIRQEFGMSPREFFDSPDFLSMATSDKYKNALRSAANETLEATFSKSYHKSVTGSKSFVGEVASFIEDIKDWPAFLGLNIAPFGRFNNNAVNFMIESTPVGLPGYYMSVAYQGRDYVDVHARAVAGSLIIAGMTYTAYQNIEKGLGYQERVDSTGEVFNTRYEYPYSFWSASAYAIAHKIYYGADTPLPPDVLREIGEQVISTGFTRDLSDTANSITRVLYSAVGEGRQIGDNALTPFREALDIYSRSVASGTRPFDPINQSITMVRSLMGEDGYGAVDRRIGMRQLNEALRYVDQPVDMLTEMITGTPLLTRRRNAAQRGDIPMNMAVTSQVNLPPLTYTNWMLNSVGIPDWSVSVGSRVVPEAAKAFNDMYFHSLERRAAELFEDSEFRNSSFERKTMRVRDLISQASNETKEMFIASDDGNDRRFSLMLKIAGPNTNNSRTNIDLMLRTYFDGRDIPDLEVEELELLDGMLGNLEDWMR